MKFARIESAQYRVENRPVSDNDIISYMRTQGMEYVPETIVYDGKMHRFSTDPSKQGDDAGWYSADIISSNVRLVYFGDWRKGIKSRFARGEKNDLTENEKLEIEFKIEQHRLQEEAERKKLYDDRASEALRLWNTYQDATTSNLYVVKKKIFPHETKTDSTGRLVVPVYNEEGHLRSLQYIPEDGKAKKFLWGTSVNGCFWWLGDPEAPRVFLVEGFATGASVNEATGSTVFIAFSASSIPKVAKILHDHGKDVTIVADNDPAGREWAEKAEGCHIVTVPMEGFDANDFQNETGNLREILPDLSIESKMLLADDILNEDLSIHWLIKNWIPSDSIGMIHGQSASGKTTILLDMLLSATSGKDGWCGNRIPHPISTVYLCGEGLTGVKRRLRAWKARSDMPTLGHFAVYPLPLDLDTPAGVHEIRSQIDILGWKPDIIVIDTVNRFMSGDENSAQDTRTLLNCVDTLRSVYSCSGLYVHHTGNNEETQKRARGSSAWRGALDFEISVTKLDDNTREIEQVKMKDSELMPKVYGIIDGEPIPGVFDDEGEQVTGAVFSQTGEPESEQSQKLDEAVRLMLLVYSASGRKDNHIERNFWKQWLVDNRYVKDLQNASVWMSKTSDTKRPIGRLFEAGILTKEGDGFYINPGPKVNMELGFLNSRKDISTN